MGFLSGSVTFECFRITDPPAGPLGAEQIKRLKKYAIRPEEQVSGEQVRAGLLAGDHLFDQAFSLEKNILNDALHFAMRIDTNQVPAAVRKAWLQIELSALRAENPERRLTKAERQEAKDAVQERCDEAAREGQYHKMQQFPLLWDTRDAILYFGGTSASAGDVCKELVEKAFEIDLSRLSSGRLAYEWAGQARRRKALNEISPTSFLEPGSSAAIQWWNGQSGNYDYLGNEFLLWLWWNWDTRSDTIELSDGSEVVGMFARTLTLECPRGESGKGTISAEVPTALPEAAEAIQSGKLPRKAGLTLVRQGEQYDLALQAETFAVSGAKVHSEEGSAGRAAAEERIDSLRSLHETLRLLFEQFCDIRIGEGWEKEANKIRKWLQPQRGRGRG